jgi:hypothetical protein
VLARLTIHATAHVECRVVEVGDDAGTHWAEAVEALGARELPVFLLQVAGGDVVHAGEAEERLPHFGR